MTERDDRYPGDTVATIDDWVLRVDWMDLSRVDAVRGDYGVTIEVMDGDAVIEFETRSDYYPCNETSRVRIPMSVLRKLVELNGGGE